MAVKSLIMIEAYASSEGLKGDITMSRAVFERLVEQEGSGAWESDDVLLTIQLHDFRSGECLEYQFVHLGFKIGAAGVDEDEFDAPPEFDNMKSSFSMRPCR